MNNLLTRALAATLLLSTSAAENRAQPRCADIEEKLRFNTSTSYDFPALFIDNERPNSTLRVQQESNKKWRLIYRVQENEDPWDTKRGEIAYAKGSIFLDVGDPNNKNMRNCHHTILPQNYDLNYQWTRDRLERSLKDTGDCREMLGVDCIDALKTQYKDEAADRYMRGGRCRTEDMPAVCEQTWPAASGGTNMTQDLTSLIDKPRFKNSVFDAKLECDGLYPHRTRSVAEFSLKEYDIAVRFPVVEVLTFWPNRSDPSAYTASWRDDVHVEVLCLRPDQIKDGSVVPPSGEELLMRPSAGFSNSGEKVELSKLRSLGMPMLWSSVFMAVLLAL